MDNIDNLDLDLEIRENNTFGREIVPNSGGILTLGILSIIFVGFIGLILSIICLSLSSGAERSIKLNPGKYTQGSIKNARAGKVCGIIGISIFGLIAIIVLIILVANA